MEFIWGIIAQASIINKFILLVLMAFSITTWAIFIKKLNFFKKFKEINDQFYKFFAEQQQAEHLDRLAVQNSDSYYAQVYIKLKNEMNALVRLDTQFASKRGISHMERLLAKYNQDLSNNLSQGQSTLATISSMAVYVGLLGTVWGIIIAFQGLATTQGNAMDKIAPGIAEALFATAIGLIAAIPAGMIYNLFQSKVKNNIILFQGYAQELLNRLEKDFFL